MYALDAAVIASTDPSAVAARRTVRRQAARGHCRWRRRCPDRAGHGRRLLAGRDAPSTDAVGAVGRPPAESGLSVAVLVFTNQSGDAAQDYFSDGLTEDITRALGRFKQLTVLAYGAVLPFRGKELPLSEIGRALNARYLVGGSVRRMGERVRVTVQLSDAANGTQLWAEQYDDEMTDIFAVQERIARRVAGTLASNLQQIALQQSLRKPTDNLDAYDLLLRSRALANESTRAGNRIGARAAGAGDAAGAELRRRLRRARRCLFPARDVRLVGVRPSRTSTRRSGWPRGRSSSTRNACSPTAFSPAPIRRMQKYDLGLAESERALQINPSDAEALLARAAVLLWTGRIDEFDRGGASSPSASTPISVPRPRSISASPTC